MRKPSLFRGLLGLSLALNLGLNLLPGNNTAARAETQAKQSPDQSQTRAFALPTTDGKATLYGQLDLPATTSGKVPLVVMTAGSGLFDRDVRFGAADDPRSMLFKHLSQQLNARGVATLRYDYRGVCHMAALPACTDCQTPQEKACYMAAKSFDNSVRAGVNPDNIRADLLQAYNWGSAQTKIDTMRVVVLGHSEGSVHTARLLKDKAFKPSGVVLIGGLYESPGKLIEWQMVTRMLTQIMQADANGDNKVSSAELTAYHPQNDLLQMYPLQVLLPPEGHWTTESLKAVLEAQYAVQKNQALSSDDSAPFGGQGGGVVQASMAWWKMFFAESPTLASWFHAGGVPVINHLGDRDSQISPIRQQQALQALPADHQLKIVDHPGQGHALGPHMLMGPMSEASEKPLLDSIMALLKQKG
ncbi:MAG: hypothetical protein IGS03_17575 [Candidatus Sericytochromatia bacterium]|nr:hypothetical protein [Candidatus Sericytochromatia bacterium]